MESYTSMSNEGIEAAIHANEERMAALPTAEPVGFGMSLSGSDFEGLMWALKVAADCEGATEETADWAAGFASSIAEALGVEFI